MFSINYTFIFTLLLCLSYPIIAAEKDLSALLIDLKSDDINMSTTAANSIVTLGKHARKAIPNIILKFNEPHGEARASFIESVASFGILAVPDLIRALDYTDISIRRGACIALGKIGSDASGAIDSMDKLLSEPGYDMSHHAAKSLGQIGIPAIPKIINILKSDDEEKKSIVISRSFSQLPHDSGIETYLLKIINNKNEKLSSKYSAIQALKYVQIKNTEVVISILVKLLGESEGNLGSASAHTLGKIGPVAAPAVIDVLKSQDVNARSWATYAIKFMHPPVKKAIPDLTLLLKDQDIRVRLGAKSALERINSQ